MEGGGFMKKLKRRSRPPEEGPVKKTWLTNQFVVEIALLPEVNLWKILVTDLEENKAFVKADRNLYSDDRLFSKIGGKDGLEEGEEYAFLIKKEPTQIDELTSLPYYYFSSVMTQEDYELEAKQRKENVQRIRALFKRNAERSKQKNEGRATQNGRRDTTG